MKVLKAEEGFTLIEISISVAMLAFISVVVIKLFLAASNINVKASEVDMATILISNELEILYDKTSLASLSDEYIVQDEEIVKKAYFDDLFVLSETGKYGMTISMKKETDALYKVDCTFMKGEKEIMSLETYKHFKYPFKKVGDGSD